MNVESEAFQVLLAIVRQFEQKVLDSGRHFIFVIFPSRDSDVWGDGSPSYAPLMERLPDTWIVELGPQLARDARLAPENLRAPGRHLSGLTNGSVAQILYQELERAGLVPSR